MTDYEDFKRIHGNSLALEYVEEHFKSEFDEYLRDRFKEIGEC